MQYCRVVAQTLVSEVTIVLNDERNAKVCTGLFAFCATSHNFLTIMYHPGSVQLQTHKHFFVVVELLSSVKLCFEVK